MSSQPSPQRGMIVRPRSKSELEKDLLDDPQRLRGGGLACACCGDNGDSQRRSPLEPQPETTKSRTREAQETKPPANQEVPRLSKPIPPEPISQPELSVKNPKEELARTPLAAPDPTKGTPDPLLIASSILVPVPPSHMANQEDQTNKGSQMGGTPITGSPAKKLDSPQSQERHQTPASKRSADQPGRQPLPAADPTSTQEDTTDPIEHTDNKRVPGVD
ncbi:hypothetical protein RhiJN_08690 [Ceratobasidium sp. AG-Ba]|nr:hypothetical protein RhiJN_08690 [Ceratobasidium sp. AG-Ba]QRW09469.1 hypothetical protein RhiLY_08468 [Ceratobasidium sp. AG-Ba]